MDTGDAIRKRVRKAKALDQKRTDGDQALARLREDLTGIEQWLASHTLPDLRAAGAFHRSLRKLRKEIDALSSRQDDISDRITELEKAIQALQELKG